MLFVQFITFISWLSCTRQHVGVARTPQHRANLYTAAPVWRGPSAASCSAGTRWVECTSGSGRCEELWPSTAGSCPVRWDGRRTTASWSAALCRGSNPTGSSAVRRRGDEDQKRSSSHDVSGHVQPRNQIHFQASHRVTAAHSGFQMKTISYQSALTLQSEHKSGGKIFQIHVCS